MPSLAVFGGTGFLGRQICKTAVLNGWSVTSVSRTGPQHEREVIPNVEYISSDIFKPELYAQTLASADAVVHSIGAFMDSPGYKSLVSAPLMPSTVLKLAQIKLQGRNPMSRSLQRLNYDSAVVLADAANRIARDQQRLLPFIYVSAENWSQMADEDYIRTKRQAEHDIASQFRSLRPVFLRPGFMFDDSSPSSCWPTARSALTAVIGAQDQLTGRHTRVSIQTVAAAALEAARDEEIQGAVSNEALSEFDLMR